MGHQLQRLDQRWCPRYSIIPTSAVRETFKLLQTVNKWWVRWNFRSTIFRNWYSNLKSMSFNLILQMFANVWLFAVAGFWKRYCPLWPNVLAKIKLYTYASPQPLQIAFVSACALLPSFVTVSIFIAIMSTELFCETLVAGGATVTLHFRFTRNPYDFVPVVWWAALLIKLWLCVGFARL